MAERDKQDPPNQIEKLTAENTELRKNLFLANELQLEMRQLLSNTQFELAMAKAQLKLATQPTA